MTAGDTIHFYANGLLLEGVVARERGADSWYVDVERDVIVERLDIEGRPLVTYYPTTRTDIVGDVERVQERYVVALQDVVP